MRLVVVGLNHKTAPVETREAFAVPSEAVQGFDRRLVADPSISEAIVLSTCNRVELWAVPAGATEAAAEAAHAAMLNVLATERGLDPGALKRHGYSHSGDAAARHLVRVCSSLDSLVVGEAQILAQTREAFQSAREAGTVGPVLERVVQAAFRGAKAVRTETGIAEETVSIGSVAVELAQRIFPSIGECSVLVVGAGKMGRVTARALARHGVREVVVTNRSLARAEKLATELGWVARPFEELDDLLVKADVVLTCTGADRPVLDLKRMRPVMRRRKYRPLFLVDIAVPRDVDPAVAELDQLYLYNIDDLEAVSREHLAQRQTEAAKAERIVDQTLREIAATEKVGEVVPILKAVREHAEEAARGELERAFHKRLVHLTTEEREAVRETVQRVVNKLLHPAMAALRDDRGALVDLPTAARVLHGLEHTSPGAPGAATEGGPAPAAGHQGES